MPNMIRAILFTTLLLALVATAGFTPGVAGQGEHMDYLPFSRSLLRPFKLKKIELSEDLRSGRALKVAGVQIQEEKAAGTDDPNAESIHRLVFSGRNARGNTWRISAPAAHNYDALYEGDLDKNGIWDLILAISTGGNGLAPSTRLIFVTFDLHGQPTLFEGTGYYQPLPDGILDVADLDGDGRAELVHMVFDDGYWITDVYTLRNSRWRRVKGRLAGLRFPLYTRFTNRPNHKPVKPARGRNPASLNLLTSGNG